MRTPTRLSLAALAVAAGLAGPVLAQPAPYTPIPPLREEVVPPPPGARYMWAPGHWRWDGVQYVWVGGEYVLRHRGWHHWVQGAWVLRRGAWVWVPGHWV